MPSRLARALLAVVTTVTAYVVLAPGAGAAPDVDPFRGLGAWIDVFDYVPAFRQVPGPVPVDADSIDDFAALGAETIYLQAAIDDPREKGLVVDRSRVGALLRRAHDAGVEVVAWYYPQLADLARDQARLDALLEFRSGGERFDAVALDIESRLVPDVTERNKRLVQLTKHVRDKAGNRAVGAIVYPAVQLEVVSPLLWPEFPYRRLDPYVDVWLPMTYWTFRDGAYRDAFTYTDESIRRLRSNLRDRHAAVHPIGGLGEATLPADYQGFMKAARQTDALGWSIYDADTTRTTAWRFLRDEES